MTLPAHEGANERGAMRFTPVAKQQMEPHFAAVLGALPEAEQGDAQRARAAFKAINDWVETQSE